jgi:hypothetical protein
MEKLNPMDVLFLDIETTHTTDPVAIERIASKVKPPGNMSKAETIAKWEVEVKPSEVAHAVGRTALNGGYGSIVAAGLSHGLEGESRVLVGGEDSILRGIMNLPTNHGAIPRIVGHNIVDFDLKFIRQRCIVKRIPIAGWFPRDPKPWDPLVCDTMVAWCGSREMISLSELAYILGIKVKPTIEGKEVPRAFQEGRMPEIIDHCVEDLRVVKEIYKSMVAAGL